MTDCLSEDDDEAHHPVHLIEGIVHSCTRGADEKLYQTRPGSLHISTPGLAGSRAAVQGTQATCPVFYPISSGRLMGL